jgi:DNA-binding GntR family transcriptional regulator
LATACISSIIEDMETVAPLDWKSPLASNALRHDVVVRVMAAIFRGTLLPESRLNIRKMAEQMGVSATPIREALVELEGIGLVRFSHNRGAVVKPFGRQQLQEIYHLRRILESEAVRCACGRIPRDGLTSLKGEMRQLVDGSDENAQWSERAMAADRAFHDLTAAHCGSDRLADEIGRYTTLVQTIRDVVGNRRQAHRIALKEHLAVIAALLAGDSEKAATAMSRHIQSTLKSVEAVMFPAK